MKWTGAVTVCCGVVQRCTWEAPSARSHVQRGGMGLGGGMGGGASRNAGGVGSMLSLE